MSKNLRKPRVCPNCHRAESVRTVLYGMPTYPVDESEHMLGGCVIDEADPRYRCINCGTSIL